MTDDGHPALGQGPDPAAKALDPRQKDFFRLNRDSALVFRSVMPPDVREMIEAELRKIRSQFRRGAANIAAGEKMFAMQRFDMDCHGIPEQPMGRLEGAGQRGHIDGFDRQRAGLFTGFRNLRQTKVGQSGVTVHRIDPGCSVMQIESGLCVPNQMNKLGHGVSIGE